MPIFVENHKSMRNKIFAILYHSAELAKIEYLGTGFVVSHDGRFVTAGHTFGKLDQVLLDNKKFRAVFIDENNKYRSISFSTICYKYLKKDKQNPPLLYDIAYGSLEKGEYDYFTIDDKIPVINERLCSPHYKNTDKENTIGLSFADTLNIICLGYFTLPMYVSLSKDASVLNNTYSNCMKLTQSTNIAKGASGCPLVNANGNVSGLFIAASEKDNNRYAVNPISITELSQE